jgi:hypothetical protein
LLSISVWRVHEVVRGGPPDWRRYLAAAVPLLLVALMRPQGWLIVLLAATYWAISQPPGSVSRRLGWVLAAVALLIALFVPTLLGSLDRAVVGSLVHGRTMWGSDRWTIEMPAPDSAAGPRGVTGAAQYALGHPAKVATLMLARVGVHFAHVRPFYSTAHDVLIVLWLTPVYLIALRGWQTIRGVQLARWLLGIIAAQTGLVAITHADWDGRYLAYVLPLIYVVTGCGAEETVRRLGRRLGPVSSQLIF